MPAIGAVAGIDIIVVALVAAILAFALVALYRPFVLGALGALPLIGGFVQASIESLLLRVAVVAALWSQSAIQPATALVDRVWAERHTLGLATLNTLQIIYNVLAWVRGVLDWIIGTYVPAQALAVLVDAYNYANYVAGIVDAHVRQALAESVGYTNAVAGQLQALAFALYDRALALALAEDQAVDAYVRQAFGEAVAYVDAVAGRLETIDEAFRSQALGYTQAAVGALEAVLGAEAERRLAGDREGALEAAAAAAAAGAAALAGAGALVGAVVTRVTAIEDSPCQQYCSPLGDLGQLLQGLEDAGLVALLIGLIVQAQRDPAGLAREIQDGFVGPAQELLAAVGFTGAHR